MNRPVVRYRIVGFLLLAGLAGCVAHERIPGDAAYDPAPTAARPFAYQPGSVAARNQARNDLATRHHRVRHLKLPSLSDNGHPGRELEVLFYESRAAGARPLVVILPIWGRYTFPPRTLVNTLRRRNGDGLHLMRVLGEHDLFDWNRMADAETPADFEAEVRQMVDRAGTMVRDLRRLLDWTEQRGVAVSNTALVGFSISAVVGSLALAAEPRFDAAVLVMGGAHPEQIFAACDGRPQWVRERILDRFGWTVAEYRALFERSFTRGDPASYRGLFPPSERILMIDTLRDQCMPGDAREAFWDALGRPPRLTLAYGHKQAFLGMTYLGFGFLNRAMAGFLEKVFSG